MSLHGNETISDFSKNTAVSIVPILCRSKAVYVVERCVRVYGCIVERCVQVYGGIVERCAGIRPYSSAVCRSTAVWLSLLADDRRHIIGAQVSLVL